MTEKQESIDLFNDVVDLLKDYDSKIEQSEGLIFRRLTEGQECFITELKAVRVEYLLYLWPGQKEYIIDDWIMEITSDIKFNRQGFNPFISIPKGTIEEDRKIIIHDYTDIEDGDIMIISVYVTTLDEVIDRYNSPIINKKLFPLLVDYVLSFYRKHNEEFKTREEVKAEAKKMVSRLKGINSAGLYTPTGFMRF